MDKSGLPLAAKSAPDTVDTADAAPASVTGDAPLTSGQPGDLELNCGRRQRPQGPHEHRAILRRQCQAWNADPAHQRAAGKARATGFTAASQSFAGSQAYSAASARWRAEHGLRPLDANAVRSYVVPGQIRDPLGQALPAALQRIIFDAWIAGFPHGVSFWLSSSREGEDAGGARDTDVVGKVDEAELPFPPGSLFAQGSPQTANDAALAAHDWQERVSDPGWLVCTSCWSVAICPAHLPAFADDPDFARLRLAIIVCERHEKGHGDGAWE